MKRLKVNKLFLMSITLCIGVILFPFLFLDKDFIVGYDIKNLYVPFYSSLVDILECGELPFWNHNYFLGINLWASKGYYFLGDVFAYLIILFKNIDFFDFLLIIQILKYILGYLFFSLYLKELGIKKEIRWFVALFYVFSSWSFVFMGTPSFATSMCFIPVLFYAIERYLNKNKCGLVIFASFILVCSCFYIYWSISFFLVLYWPIRYFIKYPFNKQILKSFVFDTLRLVGLYIAGVLIAAPLIIPTGVFMINSPRVVESIAPTFLWNSIEVYLDMFVKFISAPVYVNTNIENFFGNNYYRTDQICLFTSSLTCLLLPQLFIILKGQKKKVIIIFFIIIGLMLISPIGGSIMHGFAEASFRWTLLLLVCLIALDAYVLNNLNLIDKGLLLKSFVVYLFGIFIVLLCVDNPFQFKLQFFVIIFSLLLMVVYIFELLSGKVVLIGFTVMIELMIIGSITFNVLPNYKEAYNYDEIGIESNYFDKFDNSEFYRVYFTSDIVDMDYCKDFNYNSNLYYNYKGFYSYDSTVQNTIKPLLNWEEQYYWWYSLNNPQLINNLSMKYVVTEYEENLPRGIDFEFLENIGDSKYSLYLNKDYKPFGYTADIITYSDFISMKKQGDIDGAYGNGIVIDDYYIDMYDLRNITNEHKNMINIKYSNNKLSGDILLESKQLVFFSIPYDEGWTLFDNDEVKRLIPAEGGMMAAVIDEGSHHLRLSFRPKGVKLGLIISGVTTIALGLVSVFKKRK